MSEPTMPPPAPRQLVQMLRIHMWSDHCDDDSRVYHEWCADTLEQLLDRTIMLAKKLEVPQ